ncbi:unnamed protein product [[Actinomadura] parvosata subsp. kistnae]|nr:unnamed protein product [Actinomadura parvosata subsp. kistnae]
MHVQGCGHEETQCWKDGQHAGRGAGACQLCRDVLTMGLGGS